MDDHPSYRDDDLSKKDTGPDRQAVSPRAAAEPAAAARRPAVQGLLESWSRTIPRVDPFDTLEMIGVVPTNQPRPALPSRPAAQSGAAVPTKEKTKTKRAKKKDEDKTLKKPGAGWGHGADRAGKRREVGNASA